MVARKVFVVILFLCYMVFRLSAQFANVAPSEWSFGIGPSAAIDLPFDEGATFGLHSHLAYLANDRAAWTFRSTYLWSNEEVVSSYGTKFKPYYQWQVALGFQYAMLGNLREARSGRFALSLAGQMGFSYGFQEIVYKNNFTNPDLTVEESVKGNYHAVFIASGLVFNYTFNKSGIYLEVLPQLDLWSKTVDDYRKYDPVSQRYRSYSDSYTEVSSEFTGLHLNLGYRFRW